MPTLHPLTALAASIALVVFLIGWCRLHAFFALLLGALAIALTTGSATAAASVESVLKEMGALTGSIGYSIAAAAVIGAALMESGAADKIVRTFIRVLGEKRAPLALLGSGFLLAVPVFFDTVFFLLIPLARALTARTGKSYVLHVMAICAGAVVTHSTVPPTPGPLAMAEIMKLDTGFAILAGTAAGILPAFVGLWFARWLDSRRPVEMRTAAGSSVEAVKAAAARDESGLPGFLPAVAPVVVPVLLIAAVSVGAIFRESLGEDTWNVLSFFGNKNVALSLGGLIAVAVYLRQTKRGWRDTSGVVGEPLGTAGVIILITAAGGAYGAMIRNSGVGDVLRDMMSGSSGSILLLGWGLAALLKAAQGSTTVAVITTAGLMTSLGGAEGMGVHPLFLYLAIGYGGLFCSWMNDSGFWIFSRMSGFTEGETLRSWSVLLCIISVVGLAETWLLSMVFR
jgi:GntP family gluconate:H+ symporter